MKDIQADPTKALDSLVRQGRVLAVAYGSFGVAGLLLLLVDHSWLAIAGAVVPLQIGVTDWMLSARVQRIRTRRAAAPLLWHQVWVLAVGLLLFGLLLRWPLEPVWEQMPLELRRQLTDATAVLGLEPLAYLQLVWAVTLILTSALFCIKIAVVSARYWRLLRRLPETDQVS